MNDEKTNYTKYENVLNKLNTLQNLIKKMQTSRIINQTIIICKRTNK